MKTYLYCIFTFCLFANHLLAQANLCEGSLGENIFTDGDFGSGTANVVATDPGLAPGYTYQSSPPPQDGLYTLANNTTNWGSFANTFWINIGDNSNDPQGYMMVVNASNTPGIFYERTIDDLCENTVYQFSADIINLFIPGQNGNLPNVDFLLDGTVQYSTGNIAEDASWNTYGFLFSTGPGETSKTLTLRNNAPGGFGNDLALDNISFRACGPEVTINTTAPVICDGESAELVATVQDGIYDTPVYQWQQSTNQGLTWTDLPDGQSLNYPLPSPIDGVYYRIMVANGSSNLDNNKCRAISPIHILEVQPIYFDIETTICEGLSIDVGTSTYNESGTYLDSLIASYGCDSIVTTTLTVVENDLTAEAQANSPACFGESSGSVEVLNVNGASGIYQYSINGGAFQDNSSFPDLPAGQYLLTVIDEYGCDYSDTVSIIDPTELVVDLPDQIRISLGEDFQLNAIVNPTPSQFSWSPTDGLSCTDCLDPVIQPIDNIIYALTAALTDGCTASDSIRVLVDKNRRVYFPNAFSPNDDGINDHFFLFPGESVEQVVAFQIFDRWGELLFEKDQITTFTAQEGWDGTFNGKPMPQGIFAYRATLRFLDGVEFNYAGDFLLVR
jgi:gliding motility-associated-like protein